MLSDAKYVNPNGAMPGSFEDRQKFLWEKQKELAELQKQWLEEEMQAFGQGHSWLQQRVFSSRQGQRTARRAFFRRPGHAKFTPASKLVCCAQMGAMKTSMGRYTEELKRVMKDAHWLVA